MHKTNFKKFLRNNPDINFKIQKEMMHRIQETSQVRKNLIESLRSTSKTVSLIDDNEEIIIDEADYE
jgi:hypothetical protein